MHLMGSTVGLVGSKVGIVGKVLGRKLNKEKKKNGREYEQLKKRAEYFVSVRDAIEEEKISELLRGNMPRREHQSWLEEAEMIISEQNFSHLEIDNQLEKSIELGLVIHVPLKITKSMTFQKVRGEKYGLEKKSGMTSLQQRSGTKAKPVVASSSAVGKKSVQRKKMEATVASSTESFDPRALLHDLKAAKQEEVIPQQTSKPHRVPVVREEGNLTLGISDDHEADTNYLIDPDYLATESTKAETKHEIIHLAESKSLSLHGIREEIESDPDDVEIIIHEIEDKNLTMPEFVTSITPVKIEPPFERKEEVWNKPTFEASIPPEIEEEDWMKPDFRTSTTLEIEEEDQLKPNIRTNTTLEIEEKNQMTLETGTSSNLSETRASPDFVTHVPEWKPKNLPSNVEFSTNKGNAESYSPTSEGQESARRVKNAKRPIHRHIGQTIFRCMRDDGTATTSPPHGARESSRPVINANRIDQTVNKILDFLKDGGTARRIGIYGSGGIGKTTVLKALFKHAETNKLFGSIIWVPLSRYSSTEKIKMHVAKQLLTCTADSNTNLEGILKGKNTLLLLDDVWEGIDLDALGIPNTGQDNGCSIILTAKSIDICNMMASDTEFGMELLSGEEAWKLFHDQLGGKIDSPEIEPYARGIVKECGGLPLTIVVTGRALREENDVSAWKHALGELLLLTRSGKLDREAVIQQLKLSYNKLKDHDVKACFLYCALIQEDHKVDELISYFTNEGLLAGNSADAYERGCNVVKTLLEASLLEFSIDGISLQMHDLVRDLALAIMSPEAEGCRFLLRADYRLSKQLEIPRAGSGFMLPEDHQFLLCACAGLTDPPPKENWEQAQTIFLMDNQLFSLPENVSCPKLLNLFLERNNNLTDIPRSFFGAMPCLQGLNLSGTRIKSLPQSLVQLKRLKELVLRDCERFSTLPSEIGALEQLELLDLRGTQIYNLPNEIAHLVHLKHLLISFYGTNNTCDYVKLPKKLVSEGILSRLLLLNELSITVYPGDRRWSRCVESISKEVKSLSELVILEFYFLEVKLLDLFVRESPSWKGKGLTKFKFIVGNNVRRIVARVPDEIEFEYNQQDRCLRFVNSEAPPTEVGGVLSRATAFYLDHHLNIRKLSEFGVSNMNALEFCILRECPEIDTVIDGGEVGGSALPVLRHLSIHYLWNLRKIWEGPIQSESLSKLRFLSIHACPELSFVLPCTILGNLCNLEVLVVEDCQAVTDVILYDNVNDACDTVVLPKLKKLRLHYLPNLVRIWKGAWPPIEHISFYNCPKLEKLHMSSNLICTIKEIKAEKWLWDKLKREDIELFERLHANFTEIC